MQGRIVGCNLGNALASHNVTHVDGSNWRSCTLISRCLRFTVRDDQILVTCDVNIVGATILMPKQMVLERRNKLSSEIPNSNCSVSECQEEIVLVQKNEC